LGVDVREVMDWPVWLVAAWRTFFLHEPPVAERIERLSAIQTSRYYNSHRTKGATEERVADLLPNPDAWAREAEPEPSDEPAPIVSIFR
jgi:hypothetical protein